MKRDERDMETEDGDPSPSLDVILSEYQAANNGYNSRDAIVFGEFSVLIGIFSGLTLSMVYISNKIDPGIHLSIIYLVIGILGLTSLLGITIDMQSTHSSKASIRKRIIEIEGIINTEMRSNNSARESIRLWSSYIEKRKTYRLEYIFKAEPAEIESEIDFFNKAAYVLTVLWISIVIIFIWFSYQPINP